MKFSKLCIGTVQFGIPYGINNSFGIPSEEEIRTIFKIANQSHIDMLDTAYAYGEAESRIGELAGENYKIVAKFSKVKTEQDLINEFKISLSRLKKNELYGYMAHNADILIENPTLWKTLLNFKEKQVIQKIGYSLYSCEQLEKLLDLNLIPDIVQIPYSILDRKFETYFNKLKKLGTEIHVRSVFLQGLYFMDPENLPEKLKPLKECLIELKNCCQDFKTSIGSLALSFAISNQNIDRVVIGVDSAVQLQQNIDTIESWQYNQQLLDCVLKIDVEQKELLNPANW